MSEEEKKDGVEQAGQKEIGAILLPGIPLLPNNAVPLHIFDPRYRRMLEDAMDGDRHFAIGQLIDEETEDLHESVAEIGVLVKVIVRQQLPNNRSILIIRGEHPIRFTEWTSALPYPIANYGQVSADNAFHTHDWGFQEFPTCFIDWNPTETHGNPNNECRECKTLVVRHYTQIIRSDCKLCTAARQ